MFLYAFLNNAYFLLSHNTLNFCDFEPKIREKIQIFSNMLLHHRNKAKEEHTVKVAFGVFQTILLESHTCFAF